MTERFYDVLDVAEDATQDEIRAAYREQVKRYHPDVCDRDDAREKFKLVKEAEEVLGDPVRRKRYDQLGHEAYVGTDGTQTAADEDEDGDEVRTAAARAAAGEHDAGGRSAGWRQRERQARHARQRTGRAGDQRRASGAGADDDDPWADWMGDAEEWLGDDSAAEGGAAADGAAADRSPGDDPWTDWFEERSRAGGSSDTAAAETDSGTASSTSTDGGSASARRGSTTADRSPWDPAAGPHRRASDGGTTAGATARSTARRRGSSSGNTHAVEDWRDDDAGTSPLRPNWTQDDAVMLGACILLYPIVLVSAVFPPFHTAANVAIGLVGLAFVGFLLPRPSFAIPVFGTWSVLSPVALVALGVPIVSGVGLLAIGATWLPLLYALTIGYVFLKTG